MRVADAIPKKKSLSPHEETMAHEGKEIYADFVAMGLDTPAKIDEFVQAHPERFVSGEDLSSLISEMMHED